MKALYTWSHDEWSTSYAWPEDRPVPARTLCSRAASPSPARKRVTCTVLKRKPSRRLYSIRSASDAASARVNYDSRRTRPECTPNCANAICTRQECGSPSARGHVYLVATSTPHAPSSDPVLNITLSPQRLVTSVQVKQFV